MKRKFIDPEEEFDPLTKLKKGLTIVKAEKEHYISKSNNVIDSNQIKPVFQKPKETATKDSAKKHQYHTVK